MVREHLVSVNILHCLRPQSHPKALRGWQIWILPPQGWGSEPGPELCFLLVRGEEQGGKGQECFFCCSGGSRKRLVANLQLETTVPWWQRPACFSSPQTKISNDLGQQTVKETERHSPAACSLLCWALGFLFSSGICTWACFLKKGCPELCLSAYLAISSFSEMRKWLWFDLLFFLNLSFVWNGFLWQRMKH